jgi:glycosyltransferase involved in cell wall biosynthesis
MNAPLTNREALEKLPHSMRVLMSVDAVGGVWRHAMELARPLRRLGVSVVFAGLGPRPSPAAMAEAQSLGEVVWLDLPLDWMAAGIMELREVPPALEALAREKGCELLHLNLPSQAAGLSGELPAVVVSHSCVPTWWKAMRQHPLPDYLQWHHELNAEGFRRAAAVIAPSFSHAEALHRCYGVLPGLRVARNGIAAFLASGPRENFVLAAGRFWDEGKNAAVMDAAAAKCIWPMRLAGACTAPDGKTIDLEHAQALGELPHGELLGLVRRAGIVVSASRYEPFGLAALEGARSGAPLVLSDIATYRELWRGAALFFNPLDPDDLAHCLNQLASDEKLRMEMGALALARSRQYTPDRQARGICEIYGEVRLAAPQEAVA